MHKKSFFLGIGNLVLWGINIFFWVNAFSHEYSSVIYFQELFLKNPFLFLFWISLNLFYDIEIAYITSFSKLNLKKYFKKIISFLIALQGFYFCLLLGDGILKWVLLIGLIWLIYEEIRNYIKTEKNYFLVFAFLLFTFFFYFYLTTDGALRLEIALKGYPIEAYETGFEELKYFEEKNCKKFIPIEKIPLKDGEIGLIEVRKVLLFQIAVSNKQ